MRMTSLQKDMNDEKQIINPVKNIKNPGLCINSELYQDVPYFFTRESAVLNLVGIYRGGSAFLVCSGPSFATLDKSLLRTPGIWTMTTYNAVSSFRGNASVTVDDPCRFNASLWL